VTPSRRALVVTVVHHPDDARVRHRQVPALLDAGWQVTYAAPFLGHGAVATPAPGLTNLDLPRAAGRHRVPALRAARRLLRERAEAHDVVLLHDPELVLVAGAAGRTPVVWDVHEDTAAALPTKPWLPRALVRPTASAVRVVERAAERRAHLLLAEPAYAARFREHHPVVPNLAPVPAQVRPPDDPRAVYVGHLTRARGAEELVATARLLAADGIGVDLVGHADAATTALLERAQHDGVLRWHGFLPLADAREVASGAGAGLSLLHDLPNYRHSQPSKVVDYLALGVPVVTTPLPRAVDLVDASGGGVVVPFGNAPAAAEAVRRLVRDPDRRRRLGAAGHRHARRHLDWGRAAAGFVAALSDAAGGGAAPAGSSARTPVPTRGA
jgi:glycosyltransferase involved in cell wall biosynthesis